MAISGSTAVVGAPQGPGTGAGVAYVFVRSGTAWSRQAVLTALHGAPSDGFGASVAISGATAVIGAPGFSTGAAYVFVRSGTAWSQRAELTASDGAGTDYFGSAVAISGSTAVVGAPGKNTGAGAAYVFVGSGTAWSQQKELTAADAFTFGSSVAIYGSTAVIGAPIYNTYAAAYVFVRSGTAWSQQAKLTASDAAAGDDFGIWVALSGSTAVVGANANFSGGAGAAYVLCRSGTAWSQQAELTASDAALQDQFGISVAIYGSTAVVGAQYNSKTGAAYVFGNV